MSFHQESAFEVRGRFAGFVRDKRGKRRMLLRAGEEALFLKLPGSLRKEFEERLVPGTAVLVSGVEERNLLSGWVKRIVSRLQFFEEQPASADGCAHCAIRVCAKKNCWKNGGKELWQVLEQKIAAAGLTDVLKLKAVGCLDRCKRAPNLDCGRTQLERCTPDMAQALIDHLAAQL